MSGNTIQETINALNRIRDDLSSHGSVASIELLNEPMGPSLDRGRLEQFYYDGWGNLRDTDNVMAFSDAFLGVNNWNGFGAGLWNVMVDTHHYQVFDTGVLRMDTNAHVATACGFGGSMTQNNKWTIAGEWTGAMTDCTKWLNGLGRGARYDNTFQGAGYIGSCAGKYQGSISGLSAEEQANTRRYIEAQLDGFEKATGWVFWTWKTEGAPGWDMRDLLAHGVFPQPLTDRRCRPNPSDPEAFPPHVLTSPPDPGQCG